MDKDSSTIFLTSITALLGVISLIRNITTDALVAVRFTGIVIMLASGLFMIGYAVEAPQIYTWPSRSVPIALPTCILFFIIGAGKVVIVSRLKRIETGLERNHIELNDRLEKIIATEARASNAEGRLQERSEERSRIP